MKFSKLLSLSLLSFSVNLFAKNSALTIYTYDSFASKYGPANELKTLFESECHCEVKFMPFADGVTMLNRIRLEGNKTKADIALGMDQTLISEQKITDFFIPHNLQNNSPNLPLEWKNSYFLPYDFGEYAFIFNQQKLKNPPQNLQELIERQDLKIIYQDPRTSTVGRGLLYWVNSVYGKNAEKAWKQLAKHTVTIGKGWSETYGAFLKGESDLVLSYTTSPLYHQWHEKNNDYKAAAFDEGHLLHIEVAGILSHSKQPELARQFLAFLQTPKAQKIISYYNVMKPVVDNESNTDFSMLPNYKIRKFQQPNSETIQQWLNIWQKAVSQ